MTDTPSTKNNSNLFRDNRNLSNGLKLSKIVDDSESVVFNTGDGMTLDNAWGFYLVGFTVGRLPTVESIQKLRDTWELECLFNIFKNGWIVFKFSSMEDLNRVLEASPYPVEGRPLVLKEMPQYFRFQDCFHCVPVWIKLPGFPIQLWDEKSLSRVTSQVGTPLVSDASTRNRSRLDFARVLVEVDVAKELVREVGIALPNGDQYMQKITYEFEPHCCGKCNRLGHVTEECGKPRRKTEIQQRSNVRQGTQMAKNETSGPPNSYAMALENGASGSRLPAPNGENGGSSRPFSSLKGPFTYGGSSNSPILKSEMHAGCSGKVGALHSNTAPDNNSDYNTNNDYDWVTSKRAKRALPIALQTSMANSGRKNFVDTSSRQFRLNYDIGRGRANEDVVMHENKGNGVLPPSLAHGRPASSNSYGNMSGPSHYMADVEENLRGTDERILFQAALKDLNGTTGEIDIPKGILSVSLLRHQKIALAWLIEKEILGGVCLGGILADDQGLGKTVSMIALIQMERSSQDKHKSEATFTTKPEALNLEDDGEIIVATTPIELKPKLAADDKEEILKASSSKDKFCNGKPAAGTLVVCPASVLRQWACELDEKVTDESKLSVLMYHGSNRTRDPVELAKYDVVLTTYSIASMEVPKQPLVDEDNDQIEEKYGLSSEFSVAKKQKKTSGNRKVIKSRKGTHPDASDCGALATVRWFRVILDEAQTMKNHRTQVARACCSLRAKRRWCLSGTPIQNAIDELFSYFRFLRHDPYSNYKKFVVGIKIAISRNSNLGYMRLHCVLKGIMLRRTKGTLLDGKPIITLPPKTVYLTKVDFSPEERAFYNKLEAESRSQFKAYAAAGTVNENYANILLLLLHLRQACDHPLLVKGISSDVVGRESSKIAKSLPIQKLRSLLGLLETSLAICGVCSDPPENAVVTICGHVFCFQCVSDYLTEEDTTCPEPGCKEQVSADVIFTKATLNKCLSDDFSSEPSGSSRKDEKSTVLTNKCSSKIKATLQILEAYCKPSSPSSEMNESVPWHGCTSTGHGCDGSQNSKPTKAIVFSQWTSMLDLVENSLGNTSIEYRRLDGTMSLAARDKAVKDFNAKPEVTVMLMSLKAGNLGLNMVAACHVILLDLCWNPATEDQAVDRAHRIGQTRPVTVTRLTIKDTVEDRILALQEEKRKMVASAFGEDQSGGFTTRLTMEDLRNSFGDIASGFGEDQSGGFATRLTMEDLKNLFDVRRGDIP